METYIIALQLIASATFVWLFGYNLIKALSRDRVDTRYSLLLGIISLVVLGGLYWIELKSTLEPSIFSSLLIGIMFAAFATSCGNVGSALETIFKVRRRFYKKNYLRTEKQVRREIARLYEPVSKDDFVFLYGNGQEYCWKVLIGDNTYILDVSGRIMKEAHPESYEIQEGDSVHGKKATLKRNGKGWKIVPAWKAW